jgi:GH24 family phage-related lysozyme (muramidase)
VIDVEKVKAFIASREGARLYAYLDTERIWTTGKGFNLQRPGAKQAMDRAGADYTKAWSAIAAAVAAGAKDPGDHTASDVINAKQADVLFSADVAAAIADTRRVCPQLDKLPIDAQLVLVDMCYNMGADKLAGFKRSTIPAIVAGRYSEAADHIEAAPYARQVGKRAERNCQLLRRLEVAK